MKPRNPKSFPAAMMQIIGVMTPEGAGAEVGKSSQLLYRWADPDCEAGPTITQALSLDVAYQRAGFGPGPIGQVYQRLLADAAVEHSASDPADRLLSVLSHAGKLAGEIRAAMDPNSPGGRKLTYTEQATLQGEISEAIRALQSLSLDVDAYATGPRAVGGAA